MANEYVMKKFIRIRLIETACIMAVALTPVLGRAANNDLFPGNELTLDAFGAYHQNFSTFGDQFDHSWRHGDFGGGLGATYFFIPYVGLGVDSFAVDKGPFFNNVTGNVYLRMP